MSQLKSQGFTTTDWLTGRLTPEEVEETVQQIALLHAAGLAYRSQILSVGGSYVALFAPPASPAG